MPKVSVIMPVYNSENFISEAIESILSQSFIDFEFIIIDDASTDRSWEIIQQYADKDKRIVPLRNESNLKICKTLNKGLEIAKGEYIARMDSDDISIPHRLSTQVDILEKNKHIGVVGANCIIIDGLGKIGKEKTYPELDSDIRKSIWMRNPFLHPSVIFRKECYVKFGGYDNNFLYAEDLELWIRFGQSYKFHNIQDALMEYRMFGGNTTLVKQKQMINSALKVRRKAIKLGYIFTIKGVIFYIGTWFMQFLPPKFVLFLFNILIHDSK